MGWSSQVVTAQQVIIDGEDDWLLEYNGTPADGTLTASVAALPGTDSEGNAYFEGITLYTDITGTAVALNLYGSGFLNSPIGMAWYSAATQAGPYGREGFFSCAPVTAPGWVSSPVYGQQPPAVSGFEGVPDTWNYVGGTMQPAFGAGWSNRGSGWAELAFQMLASPPSSVRCRGWCTASATSDVTLFTLPSGYRPASAQTFLAWSVTAAAVAQFNVAAAGTVSCASAALPAAGNYWIDFTVSLDI